MFIEKIDVRKCHWQVIINPNALSGRCGEYWRGIASLLKSHGITYTARYAHDSGAGTAAARRLCQQGERHFIVLGGDGTLNEVVNGIAENSVDQPDTFIVPFPVGTGNDWAKTHHYPQNPAELIPAFLEGNFLRHDIGRVESLRGGRVVARRYFINIAGFGFDAAVIASAKRRTSRWLAPATYLLSLIRTLFTYHPVPARIITPDKTLEDFIFTIAVGIGQFNGNGMRQVPMGDPTDGLFDIVSIREIAIPKIIANISRLFQGGHIHLKEVTVQQADEVWIHSKSLLQGEVEGEMLVPGNYHLECLQGRVNVLKV